MPVWLWALIGVALIVGVMYWKKIGFFAPAANPADTSSQGASAGPALDPNFPLDLGGLAGGGNPATPLAQTQVVPSMFDPSTGSYAGQGSSTVGPIQGPSVNYDNFGGGGVLSGFGSAVQNFAGNVQPVQSGLPQVNAWAQSGSTVLRLPGLVGVASPSSYAGQSGGRQV